MSPYLENYLKILRPDPMEKWKYIIAACVAVTITIILHYFK